MATLYGFTVERNGSKYYIFSGQTQTGRDMHKEWVNCQNSSDVVTCMNQEWPIVINSAGFYIRQNGEIINITSLSKCGRIATGYKMKKNVKGVWIKAKHTPLHFWVSGHSMHNDQDMQKAIVGKVQA